MIDFFCDMSYWQSAWTKDKLKLLQDRGMIGAILRFSEGENEDTLVDKLADWCGELGIPIGGYMFPYPGIDFKKQLDVYAKVVSRRTETKSYFIDVEYYQYGDKSIVPESKLSEYYVKAINAFYQMFSPSSTYTAAWMTEKYAKGVVKALDNKNWLAAYVKYWKKYQDFIYNLGGSYDRNSSRLTSIDNMQSILEFIYHGEYDFTTWLVSTGNKFYPTGVSDWGAWQFNTYWPFKELTKYQRPLDINFIKPEQKKEWFGIKEVEETQEQMTKYRWNTGNTTVTPI